MNDISWWPTLFVLLLAVAWDVRTRRIPNWLVVPYLIAGVVLALAKSSFAGLGTWAAMAHYPGLLQSLAGMALGAALTGVLWWMRGMGMGDVKLCAAIGAWIGPSQLVLALVVMGLAGGLMALIVVARSRSVGRTLDGAGDLLWGAWGRRFQPHPTLVLNRKGAQSMPYAPAIAIGTLFSFFAQ